MQITIHESDQKATLKLEDYFDIKTRHLFKDSCERIFSHSEVKSIDIDFSDVNYIDSAALGMLLILREKSELAHVALSLVNCDKILHVLKGVFFHNLFTLR